MVDLIVKDNFFADPSALRADVLSRGFQTVTNPSDGVAYTGIQVRDPKEWEPALSELLGFPVKVNTSIARINFEGELPNQSIHADHGMGEFAAVGYLTPPQCPATATAFWTDRETGWEEMPTVTEVEARGTTEERVVARLRAQADDASKWAANAVVFARFGRLVVYPTKRFHSRYPFEAFGKTPETARLILAIFFDRAS
jgi:hypothetical protein